MPTALTEQAINGPYDDALTAITWEAADVGSGNEFTLTGNEIILVRNTDASAHNVTLTSVADPFGRTGDISSESIAADEYKAFKATEIQGWRQSDGKFYLSADDTTVEFAILKL